MNERWQKWKPGHIPANFQADVCRRARQVYCRRFRAQKFREDLARLGERFTREDVLALFQTVYKRGYNVGYQLGRKAALRGDTQALPLARERDAA